MNVLLAVGVGLIAGLLLSPQTGKENREQVKEQFNMYKDRLMRTLRTNGGGTGAEGVEGTGRADYLH
jgi:gas vesicle protein